MNSKSGNCTSSVTVTENFMKGVVFPSGSQLQVCIENGKKEGKGTVLSPSSITLAELHYQNDMLNGLCILFNEKGEKEKECFYENDKQIGLVGEYKDGKLVSAGYYSDWEDYKKTYEFKDNQMTEYSGLGKYEGGYKYEVDVNGIHVLKEGKGIFSNYEKIYKGLWKNDLAQGDGTYKGKAGVWKNGALQINDDEKEECLKEGIIDYAKEDGAVVYIGEIEKGYGLLLVDGKWEGGQWRDGVLETDTSNYSFKNCSFNVVKDGLSTSVISNIHLVFIPSMSLNDINVVIDNNMITISDSHYVRELKSHRIIYRIMMKRDSKY